MFWKSRSTSGTVEPAAAIPAPIEVEVFRAGDYGPKGRYAPGDLDRIAAQYNAGAHEAPVTVDHAQEGPAHGWVECLARRGDLLVARLRGLSGALAEALRSGAYRKPSIELDRLEGGGGLRLRAVSFLGAAVPEVKGLAAPLFREGAKCLCEPLCLEFRCSGECPAAGDSESASQDAPDGDGPGEQPAETPPGEPIPDRRVEEAIDRLRAIGRWLPAWERAGLRCFMEGLARLPAEQRVHLAEGPDAAAAADPLAFFAAFLGGLPASVALGEAAPPGAEGLAPAAPELQPHPRADVSPASLALHEAALRLMRREPALAYGEAVRRAAGGARTVAF